jgi:hypothetical protein
MNENIFRLKGIIKDNKAIEFPLKHQQEGDSIYYKEGLIEEGHKHFTLEIVGPMRANFSAVIGDLHAQEAVVIHESASDPKNGRELAEKDKLM